MRELPLADGPFSLEGAVQVEPTEAGLRPWRLLWDRVDLHPAGLVQKAGLPAGVRLTTVSDTGALEVCLAGVPEGGDPADASVDLLVDGDPVETRRIGDGAMRFDGLPAGRHRLEVHLPPKTAIVVQRVAVDDDASAERFADPRPRWVTYGSSITHCAAAHSPARTWPATAARRADVHLTCLGYGGQCHLDAMAARCIRALPADRISLKLGINVYGAGTFNRRSFAQACLGFILSVRDAHPDVPILVVSPIFAPNRETTENHAGLTVEGIREDLADVVERLRAHGDRNLFYWSGLELLGPEEAELLPDGVHPNGDGYELMGRRFAAHAFAPDGPLALPAAPPAG